MSDNKTTTMIHKQGSLAVEFMTVMHQFGWQDFAFSLQYHQINGVYQWWKTYAFKSKSVSEMHIPMILRSKFTDFVNSKKTQSLGKNGSR